MKRLVLALLAIGAILQAKAEDFNIDASVELYSSYIWRGDKVCGTQFSPSVSFKYGRWTLQSFGFLAIDGSYKEIDVDFFYTLGPWQLHVADYFIRFASDPAPDPKLVAKILSPGSAISKTAEMPSSTAPEYVFPIIGERRPGAICSGVNPRSFATF